jgi:beta-phosphoglucomutase-like phosphatase (HAD superfamily)
MRAKFEANGWRWATMVLGEQTKALTLVPPAKVADQEVCVLVDDINAGKFGKLNAGFATFGAPAPAEKERKR